MTTKQILDRGREAFQHQRWGDAHAFLSQANEASLLNPEDLESLAIAAYLTGKADEYGPIWTSAHKQYISKNNIAGAARCAFWLGFVLVNKGEMARGGGWIAHAKSLLESSTVDYVEHGYVLLPEGLRCLGEGDAESSLAKFEEADKIGNQFDDTDLISLSRLGRGQAMVRLGSIKEGAALLDEAMVGVDSGEVSPMVAGIIYCAVIETCLEMYDLARAQEWTNALTDWCAAQPQLVPYRGQCLIRRSEIMQLHGSWSNAVNEATKAIEYLTKPKGEPSAGAAFYQLGELYRQRGEFIKAEEAYRQASHWGKKPQPGFALLRLAQGKVGEAEKSAESALNEATKPKIRSKILPALVEIKLAANNLEGARQVCNELQGIAQKFDATFMQAIAAQAEGAVLLAEDKPEMALTRLRKAWSLWDSIEAPFEAAQVRMLSGMAYARIDDTTSAEMEFEAAKTVFAKLGAKPELANAEKHLGARKSEATHSLSNRELEVLRLIARGKTNKAIAGELYISERTVERHVSNIFNKLGLSSRAAATAYAFKAQLI